MDAQEPEADSGPVRYGAGRPWLRAAWRGMRGECPSCGQGKIFRGYTKTRDHCARCGLHIGGHQADDAPPYVTIMAVGHLVIPLALAVRQVFEPSLGLQFAIWIPVLIALTVWLLPVTKGGLIGVQWANGMHGFAEPETPMAAKGDAPR